ncbi:MAG: ribonuclease HII [Candidatus Gastranaerophilales bacterium]|nr:ribonuclease HII [Candidatus Gastranaerophilales bacterium]
MILSTNSSNKLFEYDKTNKTRKFLIGTDEAGRGPLAGSVVAAAVIFTKINQALLEELFALNDSKQVKSHKIRKELAEKIKKHTIYSIEEISVEEIDKINILQAALKAMKNACQNVLVQINSKDCEIFVDGNFTIPNFNIKQKSVVKGDGISASIAAASILAKVYRDETMIKLSENYPEYNWHKNKGYGTKEHIEAIKKYGATKLHRKLFLRKITGQLTLFN